LKILTELYTKSLDNYKYVELSHLFIVVSDVLRECGYHNKIIIPIGFVSDYESVPLIKGTSKRAGLIHDYLYRIDSKPVVPKGIADLVYLEAMKYRGNPLWKRWAKYWAVRLFGSGSYHKLTVETTYEEISSR
jgi:hypothetical protein